MHGKTRRNVPTAIYYFRTKTIGYRHYLAIEEIAQAKYFLIGFAVVHILFRYRYRAQWDNVMGRNAVAMSRSSSKRPAGPRVKF